jgi:hypothetical protein
MERLHDILQHLTDDLEPIGILARRFVGQHSCVDSIPGGAFISHHPRIAPLAYALRVYAGVDDNAISEYEDIQGIMICSTYGAALRKMKGASLFEISLFGLPPDSALRCVPGGRRGRTRVPDAPRLPDAAVLSPTAARL